MASIKNIIIVLLLLTVTGVSDDNLSSRLKEVIALLNSKIKTSEKILENKYNECRAKSEKNRIRFDWNTTKANKEEIFIASTYLFSKNRRMCSDREEQQFIHDLRTSIFFKKREHLNYEYEVIQLDAEFSTLDTELKNELAYLKLPHNVREYLENALGDIPCGIDCIEDFYAQRRKLKP